MKTIEEIKAYSDENDMGDAFYGFIGFLSYEQIIDFDMEWTLDDGSNLKGISPEEYNESVRSFSKENLLLLLEVLVKEGFKKALSKRSISAGEYNSGIKLLLWALEDDLHLRRDYRCYGLPLLKAVAIKYNLPNPIGDDEGNEFKYDQDPW